MEVHHHPHVNKKNFREYFLEFLMIFLAVTLGFFAENIREGFSDREKEKDFMESIVSDLKTDTSSIAVAASYWNLSNKNLDSMLIYLDKEPDDANVSVLYGLINEHFFHFDLFKYNNKTIEELKSSGSFRLIKKKEIANEIMSYDLDMKYILMQEQDVKEYMNNSKNIESKIFDFSLLNLKHFLNSSLWPARKSSPYRLLSYDRQLIHEYYNKLLTFHMLSNIHGQLFVDIKLKAVKLLQAIEKEYSLKTE